MKNRKSTNLLPFILLILFSIHSCTKEVERDFARVKTLPHGKITESGIVLRGEIVNFKSVDLEDYGFMIGEGTRDDNDDLLIISLGSDLGAATYEAALTKGLEVGENYYYMAYARSNGITTFGNDIAFTSKGSMPPALIDFSPISGQVRDTVAIRISNILSQEENYDIKFNQTSAKIIYFSDTLIEVMVPVSLDTEQSIISLTAYGTSVNFSTPFTLLTPSIESFSPLVVLPGDELTISGTNFHALESLNKVLIGSTPATVTASTKTELTVITPFPPDSLNTITVTVSEQSFTTTEKIKVKIPVLTNFEPISATYGDEIIIHGTNLSNYTILGVMIGEINTNLISNSNTEIIVNVPEDLTTCSSEVKIVFSTGTMILPDLFSLSPITVSSLSDPMLTIGDNLTIYGENFNPISSNNRVIIDCTEITPISSSPTQLVINIDLRISTGTYSVGVKTCGEYQYSVDDVTIDNPTWLQVEDFAGGNVYHAGSFTIGDIGFVGNGGEIGHNYYTKIWKFLPESNLWVNEGVYPGATRIISNGFTINGIGYLGGGYTIDAPTALPRKDYYKYNPTSGLWSQINPYPGNVTGIKYIPFSQTVNSRRYIYFGPNDFYFFDGYTETWIKIQGVAPTIESSSSSFVISDIIYITDVSKTVWAYNTASNTWDQKADFPGPVRWGGISFSTEDFGFIGLGKDSQNFYSDIWQYDPGLDQWQHLYDFPGAGKVYPFCFKIGNIVYIGGGLNSSLRAVSSVYRFEPDQSMIKGQNLTIN
jgi:hypothetical protein